MTLQGYPALVDAGDSVSLRLFDSPEAARMETRAGVRVTLVLSNLNAKAGGLPIWEATYSNGWSIDQVVRKLIRP